ncbi:MAG: cytochrome b/b6 domain-containing protein [Sulfurimicrobium sp.]|nr:cytochrome b/b6 domain-containing protein [Sulfurimicrobium sp.]MDO9189933.1 cytochrome b/b6 domain-containing protein [Sulfurimicrobium sp.]MDP1703525.1 cytochrome b/b6 domain-containing protein [Sulfurimicrobium sp.]MDP2197657.1 cytochrome b/b6 domain-containing protein [Sulfurimicrobium sp.]MDP3686509.1 cytochrome b/b6 domain-containing protein [Sulfurimicrobium sp.]
MNKIYVWDLPTRLFHWSLVALVAFQWLSSELEGDFLDYHLLGGYAILALVVFRLLWGFVGGQHARFGNFLRGVGPTLDYARALRANAAPPYLGHNPLGGWMIVALLLTLTLQGTTGLFASDDVMTHGPLRGLVSDQAGEMLTDLHKGCFNVLMTLVLVHVASIVAHRLFKKEDLVRPMLTGYKDSGAEASKKQ